MGSCLPLELPFNQKAEVNSVERRILEILFPLAPSPFFLSLVLFCNFEVLRFEHFKPDPEYFGFRICVLLPNWNRSSKQ